MSAFKNYLAHEVQQRSSKKKKISTSELARWHKQILSFDVLKGNDPGVSFCKYFGVIDFILLYHQPGFDYMGYIKKTYVF